jgi:hypothetical protein
MFLGLLDEGGFWPRYDFVYLPVDFSSLRSFGYGIVNFVSHSDALRFGEYFSNFTRWSEDSDKIGEIEWSGALQGLNNHIERYRDSPMMHKRVPDELKPLLFLRGVHVPFPLPTKQLKMPRRSKRKGARKDSIGDPDHPDLQGELESQDAPTLEYSAELSQIRSHQFWDTANLANVRGHDCYGHAYRTPDAQERRKADYYGHLDYSAWPSGEYYVDYPSAPLRSVNSYPVNVNSVITSVGMTEDRHSMDALDPRRFDASRQVEAIGAYSYQQPWGRPR